MRSFTPHNSDTTLPQICHCDPGGQLYSYCVWGRYLMISDSQQGTHKPQHETLCWVVVYFSPFWVQSTVRSVKRTLQSTAESYGVSLLNETSLWNSVSAAPSGWTVQNNPPVPVHRLARARSAKNWRRLHRFHWTSAQNQGTVWTGRTNHCTLQVRRTTVHWTLLPPRFNFQHI